MATATLRPMTKSEFDAWIPGVVSGYAADNVHAGSVAPESAQQWAAAEFNKLLPHGIQTQGHHLLIAQDAGIRIGMLWLHIPLGDSNRAFVYNLEVEQSYRGQGLGRAVMLAAEDYARSHGVHTMGLHVFGHNEAAMHLYNALGYRVTSASMAKSLT
jgi:ribosomal protein S18 acetylase RimI-like enzyme